MKHGQGKWKKRANAPSCNTYEGQYQNDKKSGLGTFTWESGNQYKGCYKDDERHGYGEMYWTDGSCYKGEWQHGIQHGVGKMEFPDGRVKEGYFENNVYRKPITDAPQLQQLKAQQLMMNSNMKSSGYESSHHERVRLPTRERVLSDTRGQYATINESQKLRQDNFTAINTRNAVSPDYRNDNLNQAVKLANENHVKRPDKLNPVMAPKKRDNSKNSVGDDRESMISISNSAYGYQS